MCLALRLVPRTLSRVALRAIVPLMTFSDLWTVLTGGRGGSGSAGSGTIEAAW